MRLPPSFAAWGVNLPARLVVVKGTEIFDAAIGRYKDMPVTDVLQMVRAELHSCLRCCGLIASWPPSQMGRAGRPGFDTSGFAVILCAQEKKNFYHKFLYEPFPVESQLRAALADHLNAEIAGGSVRSRGDALDFLSYTYFYRRLPQNPAYYGLEDSSPAGITAFLESVVDEALEALRVSKGGPNRTCMPAKHTPGAELAAAGIKLCFARRRRFDGHRSQRRRTHCGPRCSKRDRSHDSRSHCELLLCVAVRREPPPAASF